MRCDVLCVGGCQLCTEKLSVRDERLNELRAAHTKELHSLQQKHSKALAFVDSELNSMRTLWAAKEKELSDRNLTAAQTFEAQIKASNEHVKSANEQLATAQTALTQKQQVRTTQPTTCSALI